MALSAAGLKAAVDGLVAAGNFVSLHSADPGTTGASELAGGSYARQAATFGAAANGVRTATAPVTIQVPPGDVLGFGIWTAASGGSFLGGGTFTKETYGAAGSMTFTPTATVTG